LFEFYQDNTSRIGVKRSWCKDCFKVAAKTWQSKNPSKMRAWRKKYYAMHRAQELANISEYERNHPRWRDKRAERNRAMPKWANRFFISEIYHLAKLRTAVTGIKFHVDHVIPLRGSEVCGLHVENNLTVITAKRNIEKGNKFYVA
jgi:hypothetical protein